MKDKLLFFLLLAFLLTPLAIVFESVRTRYRAREAREIRANFQTIRVGTSNYADALQIVQRHNKYWQADEPCTPTKCVWRFEIFNGQFTGFRLLLMKSETLSRFLSGGPERNTLNSLGIQNWLAHGAIHVRDGNVWYSSGSVISFSAGGYARLLASVQSVRDPPEDITPYINLVTGQYDHELEGKNTFEITWFSGSGGVRYTLAKSAPEEIRREAFDVNLNCLDALRGCENYAEFTPSAWTRTGKVLRPGWWHSLFETPVGGRIPNRNMLAIGIVALIVGVVIAGTGGAARIASRYSSFVMISLGLVLAFVGATTIYMVEVAEEAALWVWPAAALVAAMLFEYGPESPRSSRARIVSFGALAIFLASLVGTLATKEDVLGCLLVLPLFASWVAVAKCQPTSGAARVIRFSSFAATAICSVSFYLVSRSWDTILDGSRYSLMTMPLGWDILLPRPYDYYIVGQGFKVLLLVSLPIASICSVAYLLKWYADTRRLALGIAVRP